jgi:glycine oxidase
MSRTSVVIVGAGVIGLTTARELALRGYAVTLIDKDEAGGGASRASAGIVSPLRPWQAHTVVDRLAAASRALFGDFVTALIDESGIDPQYLQSGMLVVGDTHRAAATGWATSTRRPIEIVDRAGLTDLIPDIGRMREGVYLPDIHQIRNPLLLEALAGSCERLGIDIQVRQRVTGLNRMADRITGVTTKTGQICADVVIIATGAWSDTFAGHLGLRLNVTPVRGQMIWYQDSADRARRPILDDGEHYAVTRQDGVTLVGATVENVGFDCSITDSAMKKLKNKARNLILGLASLEPGGQWSGLRPGRAHGIPLIGPHPGLSGLYLNTGHFHNGVTLAPGSAVLMGDILDGKSTFSVGVSTL